MNKAELIAAVADKTGFTKKDAETAVNATMGVIEETLVKEEKVQLIGFTKNHRLLKKPFKVEKEKSKFIQS